MFTFSRLQPVTCCLGIHVYCVCAWFPVSVFSGICCLHQRQGRNYSAAIKQHAVLGLYLLMQWIALMSITCCFRYLSPILLQFRFSPHPKVSSVLIRLSKTFQYGPLFPQVLFLLINPYAYNTSETSDVPVFIPVVGNGTRDW